jgi:hypothetical protein
MMTSGVGDDDFDGGDDDDDDGISSMTGSTKAMENGRAGGC